MKNEKLVLGIGQSLRGDDSAGLVAVKRWQTLFQAEDPRSTLQVELVELPGLALLDHLQDARCVLIVDAVQTGAAVGSLLWLHERELAAFERGSSSAHGWGVAETLALGRRLHPEKMPGRLDILGIEIGNVGMGEELSMQVARVIDEAAGMIQGWVEEK